MKPFTTQHYRSWVITRLFPSGMYSAWKSGELRLRADTISGLKSMIRSASPKPRRVRYKTWTLIDWDGNPALGFKCWRKSFSRGHVSVGVGDFDLIVYSYGADSGDSLSGTRSRKAYGRPDQTEKQAMAMVDRNHGHYNHLDNN